MSKYHLDRTRSIVEENSFRLNSKPEEKESPLTSTSRRLPHANLDPVHPTDSRKFYDSETLLNSLYKFISDPKIKQIGHFERKIEKLSQKLKTINSNRADRQQEELSIKVLEHAHYIYSYAEQENFSEISQEVKNKYIARENQFQALRIPHSEYKFIRKLLKFLSRLMVKWNLFDVYSYGYRYKGRGLTVNLLDMKKVNQQCLSCDVLWFSFAINHLPLRNVVEPLLENYAKVLHYFIDKIFGFLMKIKKSGVVMQGDSDQIDLDGVNFNLYSTWSQLCCRKPNPAILQLYSHLDSIEISYRRFEKHLIQQLLKFV
jgi:hypothetical protein